MALAVCGKSHSTWVETALGGLRPALAGVAGTQSPRLLPARQATHTHLQDRPAGPVAVVMQCLLAFGRTEFQQLLPLQLVGGETGQELKEGAAGHPGDVQIPGHEVLHRAGLGQPLRAGHTCNREQQTMAARGVGWGTLARAEQGWPLGPRARGSPSSCGSSVKH